MHLKHFLPKRKLFEVFFSIGCFLFTGYIIFIQFQKYLDNRDSTVVFRKHFESDKDKLYPTFSLCLKGRVGKIFDYTSKEVKCKSPTCTNIKKQNITNQCKDVSSIPARMNIMKSFLGSERMISTLPSANLTEHRLT